jgi:hypothetical protein
MQSFIILGVLAATLSSEKPAVEPMPSQPAYTHPGIVVSQGGNWVGTDHLLNLTKNIGIVVEILKPAGTKMPFDEATIEKRAADAFKKRDVEATAENSGVRPKLPFFNILLVVYPIDKGFVALIDGRLLESVDPKRVKLDKDTDFQAVTWEKKTLIVAPIDEFEALAEKTVDEIVSTFLERYEYFEKIKLKMEKKDDVERMK